MKFRYGKSLAQLMIRWSVQKGYITIPKSSLKERVIENTKVFDWSIAEEDVKLMVTGVNVTLYHNTQRHIHFSD